MGTVLSLKRLEEYLKVASKLSAMEGSEAKECEGKKKPLDFARRQLLMTLRKQGELQLGRNQWTENEGSE